MGLVILPYKNLNRETYTQAIALPWWGVQLVAWFLFCVLSFLSLTLWYGNPRWMHVFHIALQAISGAIVSLPLFFILPLLNRGGVFRRVMSHLIIIGFVAFVWNLFRMTTFDYMLSASDIWKDFGGWYFTALLVFGLFAALHYIIRAYSEIAVGRTYVETEKLRRVEAENLSREAQIKMLRYQLNPHFLFNTLNSISALIKTDRSAQARTMVSQLSDFLRSSLDKDPHQKVTLSDEVKTLELYLNIEKVRYEERLKTEFNITSKAMKGFIPSLILQPLFENALKYAIAGKIAGGIIRLTSKVEHGNLLITVEDSGARLDHGQGYVQALGVGAQTVMASFNTWNGQKIHGHKYLLTDVLKGKMGFDGFVVGDWNGHGQIPGCTDASCPQAINAGVDLIMVPTEWKAFLENTITQVKAGQISQARIDDAVRRILRVKMRAGMFEDGKPSEHELAGRAKLIGHADHRAVARQAVRESLVLLKNDNVLPIKAGSQVMVVGSSSDNLAFQSGGWTVTWQGRDHETRVLNPRNYYKGHTSILDGFKTAVKAAGGKMETSPSANADVAIVVFGEEPYAEFEGDIETANLNFSDDKNIALIKALKARNIPVVSVFLSGRPRGVDAVIEASDAFVAAWLPGSEGAGIADVLVSGKNNGAAHDFKGKLPFDWPATGGTPSTPAGAKYKIGYGLSYSK